MFINNQGVMDSRLHGNDCERGFFRALNFNGLEISFFNVVLAQLVLLKVCTYTTRKETCGI
ncbi:MAG: hypothetical protein C0402_15675 [Thermodesulfovibrio sp.]|nr:hypothetical protein [Thermodesulfovibrio sp.]